jgi:D-cysteine desulfhydrase
MSWIEKLGSLRKDEERVCPSTAPEIVLRMSEIHSKCANPPPTKIHLAHLPTPLKWLSETAHDVDAPILMKCDDETECAASGNKIRKLEYLLAEALRRRCTTVVTCGGVQSNHCRAAAILARRLGLRCGVLLRGTGEEPEDGNLFLVRRLGCEVRFCDAETYSKRRDEVMRSIASEMEPSGKFFVIPEGGSSSLGCWGYAEMIVELHEQIIQMEIDPPTHIVCAVGSGGTMAGMLAGLRLVGWHEVKVIGVAVSNNVEYFDGIVSSLLEAFSMDFGCEIGTFQKGQDYDILSCVEDGEPISYGNPQVHEIAVMKDMMEKEGVFLDPVYTGRAWSTLARNIGREDAAIGPHARVLFVHTGGIFGLLPDAQMKQFH